MLDRLVESLPLNIEQAIMVDTLLNKNGMCGACGEACTYKRALLGQPRAKDMTLQIVALCGKCFEAMAATLKEITKTPKPEAA